MIVSLLYGLFMPAVLTMTTKVTSHQLAPLLSCLLLLPLESDISAGPQTFPDYIEMKRGKNVMTSPHKPTLMWGFWLSGDTYRSGVNCNKW